jgi:large subunit ribosomal protein L18
MDKTKRRLRRKRGIRKRIHGTKARPRLSVYRSNRHIYVQAIDDDAGKTLFSISDMEIGVKRTREGGIAVGEKLAQKLKAGKIGEAVFDRNGHVYHGIVQNVAEGLRKGGISL